MHVTKIELPLSFNAGVAPNEDVELAPRWANVLHALDPVKYPVPQARVWDQRDRDPFGCIIVSLRARPGAWWASYAFTDQDFEYPDVPACFEAAVAAWTHRSTVCGNPFRPGGRGSDA